MTFHLLYREEPEYELHVAKARLQKSFSPIVIYTGHPSFFYSPRHTKRKIDGARPSILLLIWQRQRSSKTCFCGTWLICCIQKRHDTRTDADRVHVIRLDSGLGYLFLHGINLIKSHLLSARLVYSLKKSNQFFCLYSSLFWGKLPLWKGFIMSWTFMMCH